MKTLPNCAVQPISESGGRFRLCLTFVLHTKDEENMTELKRLSVDGSSEGKEFV